MLDGGGIEIGSHCQIAPRVQLTTATHPIDPAPRRDGWESAAPISIADNVWLGAGAIVCPGVSIGDDTVVGAGAVVVRDLPAGVVAVGVPARPCCARSARTTASRSRTPLPRVDARPSSAP